MTKYYIQFQVSNYLKKTVSCTIQTTPFEGVTSAPVVDNPDEWEAPVVEVGEPEVTYEDYHSFSAWMCDCTTDIDLADQLTPDDLQINDDGTLNTTALSNLYNINLENLVEAFTWEGNAFGLEE